MEVRAGDPSDLHFLEEMLFEAFYWDPTVSRPPLAVVRERPEFQRIVEGWGRWGDRALVAQEAGARIGMAWSRLWTAESHSYGFVGSGIPEIGIGVMATHRSRGVGRALLRGIVDLARADGFTAVSLSVDPANRARRLYETAGFYKVGESGTSWTLLLPLVSDHS